LRPSSVLVASNSSSSSRTALPGRRRPGRGRRRPAFRARMDRPDGA
jgi:hypothetical protein